MPSHATPERDGRLRASTTHGAPSRTMPRPAVSALPCHCLPRRITPTPTATCLAKTALPLLASARLCSLCLALPPRCSPSPVCRAIARLAWPRGAQIRRGSARPARPCLRCHAMPSPVMRCRAQPRPALLRPAVPGLPCHACTRRAVPRQILTGRASTASPCRVMFGLAVPAQVRARPAMSVVAAPSQDSRVSAMPNRAEPGHVAPSPDRPCLGACTSGDFVNGPPNRLKLDDVVVPVLQRLHLPTSLFNRLVVQVLIRPNVSEVLVATGIT